MPGATVNVNDSPLPSVDPDVHSLQDSQFGGCRYYNYDFFIDFDSCIWDKNFSLFHVNARSLNSNFNNLSIALSSIKHRFSVIGITETWFNNTETLHTIYNIPGYNFEQASREGR